MKDFLAPIIEHLRGRNAGLISAALFFGMALLWVLFGFWRMIFILLMTVIGYTVGVTFFRDMEQFKKWLDKLFPPGLFR